MASDATGSTLSPTSQILLLHHTHRETHTHTHTLIRWQVGPQVTQNFCQTWLQYGATHNPFLWFNHFLFDTFKLWSWIRLLRAPGTARISNQSILKEINHEYSLMLKLQYFGHLMGRTNSLEKTLMLEKVEGKRKNGRQRVRWFGWHHRLNEHESEQTPGDSEGQGSLACCSPWCWKDLVGLSDWTTTRMAHRTCEKIYLLDY